MKKWIAPIIFVLLLAFVVYAVFLMITGPRFLEYELNEDGTYTVVGIGLCTDANLHIPATYRGVAVTRIGGKAFYNCDSLKSIIIPDSVTSIGYGAFEDCSGLTSITIPDSVTSISNSAFYWCHRLTSITIPDSVTSIGNSAFSSCWSLTSITIPDSVTSIGNDAFSDCRSLTSITIPDSVTSIGHDAFSSCRSLTSITVSANNAVYHSDGNCLIETETNTLILGCKNSVIPDYVTSIGDDAFRDYYWLTSITIPDSVTSIGNDAVSDCWSLTSITYTGTVEQWNAITLGDDWNEDVPATEIICSDGTVRLDN